MDKGRRAAGASDGGECEGARGGASRHADEHEQSCVDVRESRTMDEGRRAAGASDGGECEGARGGASRHADEHEKSCVDVQESRTMDDGRRAAGASDGGECEGARGGASRHVKDVKSGFTDYRMIFRELNIKNKFNIINIDEAGFRVGCMKGPEILVPTDVNEYYSISPENRKSITIFENINAAGDFPPPLLLVIQGHDMSNSAKAKGNAGTEWRQAANSRRRPKDKGG